MSWRIILIYIVRCSLKMAAIGKVDLSYAGEDFSVPEALVENVSYTENECGMDVLCSYGKPS